MTFLFLGCAFAIDQLNPYLSIVRNERMAQFVAERTSKRTPDELTDFGGSWAGRASYAAAGLTTDSCVAAAPDSAGTYLTCDGRSLPALVSGSDAEYVVDEPYFESFWT